MAKNVVVWLRNDLRLHDNEALTEAVAARPQSLSVVYCLDPRHFERTAICAFPKTGAFRARFLFQSLADLRQRLRDLGNDLLILRGLPEVELPALIQKYQIDEIYFHQEATTEEKSVERHLIKNLQAVDRQTTHVHPYWGSTLFHMEDLPFEIENLPDIFTQFRVACEKNSKIRQPLISPKYLPQAPAGMVPGNLPTLAEFQLPDLEIDPRGVMNFEGGETAAIRRLDDYIWHLDRLKIYKNTRNGLLGANYSSKFSAWLAHGCLSPKLIAAEVARYERERVQNESTYWLIFELIWRDFFRFMALKVGSSLFQRSGPRRVMKKWVLNFDQLQLWREGKTGIPFVDANMRELLLTGFQSNRGRQNVASFLVKNLGIDWRAGAEWFESQLIDYDVCANWGNWAYVAGVGNDPRQDRYFHVIKQARDYDPDARYVKTWLPELQSLDSDDAHEPWRLKNKRRQQMFDAFAEDLDYPEPMIDLDSSYENLRAEQSRDSDNQSRPFHHDGAKQRRHDSTTNCFS
ncbi:MAG: DASH family cryptochrome [bacterium]